MRGALQFLVEFRARAGIIPADAGSTEPMMDMSLHPRDHPRRCGEHVAMAEDEKDQPGSSPQMRGAP